MKNQTKNKIRILWCWTTGKRSFISIRPLKQPYNSTGDMKFKTPGGMKSTAKKMEKNPPPGIEYRIVEENPNKRKK